MNATQQNIVTLQNEIGAKNNINTTKNTFLTSHRIVRDDFLK